MALQGGVLFLFTGCVFLVCPCSAWAPWTVPLLWTPSMGRVRGCHGVCLHLGVGGALGMALPHTATLCTHTCCAHQMHAAVTHACGCAGCEAGVFLCTAPTHCRAVGVKAEPALAGVCYCPLRLRCGMRARERRRGRLRCAGVPRCRDPARPQQLWAGHRGPCSGSTPQAPRFRRVSLLAPTARCTSGRPTATCTPWTAHRVARSGVTPQAVRFTPAPPSAPMVQFTSGHMIPVCSRSRICNVASRRLAPLRVAMLGAGEALCVKYLPNMRQESTARSHRCNVWWLRLRASLLCSLGLAVRGPQEPALCAQCLPGPHVGHTRHDNAQPRHRRVHTHKKTGGTNAIAAGRARRGWRIKKHRDERYV